MKEDSRTIGRYLYFWLCMGLFYASYSFVFDLVFHSKEYASEDKYYGSIGWYYFAYLVYFYISLPIAWCYNIIINKLPKKNLLRLSFGICICIAGAALFKVPSRYGGVNQKLKTIIVMALVGLSVEIIRILVIRRRERKKQIT